MTEQHIQSAIIGFYRQGAEFDRIAKVMNLSLPYVITTIQNYFKRKLV